VGITYIPQFLLIFQNQQWISMEIAPLPPFTLTWFIMSLIQAFWASTHTDGLTVYFALLVLLLTLGLFFSRCKGRGRWIPAVAAVIPFLILTGASLFTNIFVYRCIIPLGFPFFMWLGYELGLYGFHRSYRSALAVLWILLVVAGFARFRPADRGGYLDAISQVIRNQWTDGDMLIITTVTGMPFDYYLHDLPMDYYAISDNFFLQPPGMDLVTPRPIQDPSRLWVIVPNDILLSQEDHNRVDSILGDSAPLYRVDYMQTSPLEVYLIERTTK